MFKIYLDFPSTSLWQGGNIQIFMFQIFADIQEVGRSARAYAELSSRTVPMCSDVSMALIDMGKVQL